MVCPTVPGAMAGVPSTFPVPAGARSLGQAGLPCAAGQCGTECCDEAGTISRRSQKATLGC